MLVIFKVSKIEFDHHIRSSESTQVSLTPHVQHKS